MPYHTSLFLTVVLIALATFPAHAATVAYWNFNDLNISTSSAPGLGGAPTSIEANTGSGTLSLSSWDGTLNDYAGTSLNTLNSDPADTSLSLIASSDGNGSHIVFAFSMTGLIDPILTFATQGTSTGFNSNQVAYSTDGSSYTNFSSSYTPNTSYSIETFDFSSINSLDNASTVYLRINFDGATSTSGNNRIDNVQITAIPEASTLLLLSLSLATLVFYRTRPMD